VLLQVLYGSLRGMIVVNVEILEKAVHECVLVEAIKDVFIVVMRLSTFLGPLAGLWPPPNEVGIIIVVVLRQRI
jgi:hypothetical protein